eukprot:CAMPEP_0181336144 /NCGR_PEP_ID=MMETSP1101-20121128/27249_1 /TAXON_ID=46948 /ORGANISM="Rhodomonas abbreviata, Strain Caron Lab Isolate" /LENGTH=58 /DNA_ID=CAMNT_0023446393 /DNA_START=88 /DNA_END=264 /DNA_ORIENTATION=-
MALDSTQFVVRVGDETWSQDGQDPCRSLRYSGQHRRNVLMGSATDHRVACLLSEHHVG